MRRKTVSDFAHSIKDGRYREQKIRLLHNYPKFEEDSVAIQY